jgi:hypothetical protein
MTTARTTTKTKIATPTRKHFALHGPSREFDPRIDAARGDLADIRLSDRIFASHYAAAVLRRVVQQSSLVARVGGPPLSEVLAGEPFEVLELTQDQAWGISPVDHAVGFVAVSALGPYDDATHIVSSLAPMADHATVAESLAEAATPVIVGGRSRTGVDAAGLVFLSLSLAGIPAPRFLDLQAKSLGHLVGESAPVLRGDLIFTADGVAIATDAEHAVRAGDTKVELVVIADLPITARRRLP